MKLNLLIRALLFVQILWFVPVNSQSTSSNALDPFDQEANAYLNHMDSFVLDTYYKSVLKWEPANEEMTDFVIPENREEIYYKGLQELNGNTPFDLRYNNYVRAFIDLYVFKKRTLSENCLGISTYYFPIMEEVLDKHNLPLEFKYLAVVESALNIKARSRAGAAGLWQFMYRTGKSYGLEANSYIDQRYELYESTEAACKYFKDLYRIYGNWELVIAAYNCGPGNVNKAIRRSGGKRDYWDIRPWLPRETRGYVPAFIAVNYTMNYYKEHGLIPRFPDSLNLTTDTLRLKHPFDFNTFCTYFCVDENHLMYMNPSFKKTTIPDDQKEHVVRMPQNLVNAYLEHKCEFEEYVGPSDDDFEVAPKKSPPIMANNYQPKQYKYKHIHVVKSGEVLSVIAEQYNCGLSKVKAWNNLYSSRIDVGQKIIIYSNEKIETQLTGVPPKPIVIKENPNFKYHTIKPGDTLWDIAKLYDGLTVTELKNLNKDVDFKKLKPGTKLIVSPST